MRVRGPYIVGIPPRLRPSQVILYSTFYSIIYSILHTILPTILLTILYERSA